MVVVVTVRVLWCWTCDVPGGCVWCVVCGVWCVVIVCAGWGDGGGGDSECVVVLGM